MREGAVIILKVVWKALQISKIRNLAKVSQYFRFLTRGPVLYIVIPHAACKVVMSFEEIRTWYIACMVAGGFAAAG